MPSPRALVGAIIQRLLPAPFADDRDTDRPLRGDRFGGLFTQPRMRKQHALLDEGAYFVAASATPQTGIVFPVATGFVTTTPSIAIINNEPAGGKSIFLDYAKLVVTAAGSFASAGVNVQLMIYTDSLRTITGGTALVVASPYPAIAAPSSVAISAGVLTAGAALAQRVVEPLEIIRPAVSATVQHVVGERIMINSGGVEAACNGSITIANANSIPIPVAPIEVGPQQQCLIYTVANGTTPGAASYVPSVGFWFS